MSFNMEVLVVLAAILGMTTASCVPYNGPHLNQSAWESISQNLSILICQDMVPRRCDPNTLEYVPAQGSAPPFTITPSTAVVNCNSNVQILVSGELDFKSVYMQARHGDQPVGQFFGKEGTFTSNCSGGLNVSSENCAFRQSCYVRYLNSRKK